MLAQTLAPQFSALAGARHWYVGFSGGLDSTVLLQVVHAWRDRQSAVPPLTALHVNHQLQSAANAWEAHCAEVCASLGVPLLVRRVEAAGGEAGARSARYRVFEEVLPAGGVLFLAHHQDDQVETFFLRLMRGAGPRGLAAMPRRRPLGPGELVRPLLDVPRAALEAYARDHRLSHVEDPTNADTAAARNFLRVQVLPLLASRWPAYRRTVTRAARHVADTLDVLHDELGLPETVYSITGDPGLEVAALLESAPAGAAGRLRDWLRVSGLPAPDAAALGEFLRQLRSAGPRAHPRLDTGSYVLQRYRDALYLEPAFGGPPPAGPLAIRPGQTLDVPGVGRVGLVESPGGMALHPGDSLRIDWRRGGEHCRMPRRGGVSLKQLLQELAVPPWWRARVPLLYRGGELLAVGDLATCDSPLAAAPGAQRWRLHWERSRGRSD